MLKPEGAVQVAQIIAFPDKPIEIDDEDLERLSQYQWRVLENVSGRVGRRLPNGRMIGLGATLIGKRPFPATRLHFRDKNLRNFRKANLSWTDNCQYCNRPTRSSMGTCKHCQTEFNINNRFRTNQYVLRFQPLRERDKDYYYA